MLRGGLEIFAMESPAHAPLIAEPVAGDEPIRRLIALEHGVHQFAAEFLTAQVGPVARSPAIVTLLS
jgi:hypothetical protein